MLTAVKNQFKVTYLSLKYSLMRELLNKASFISSMFFMILNNSCMVAQWVVLFSLKDEFGGYGFKDIILLWGLAAGTYGVAHAFFSKSFHLSDTIVSGKLDAYIVQPKSILIGAVTSQIVPSAFGDIVFAYIACLIYSINIKVILLFTLFSITGGIILVSFAIILNSLSFWFKNTDLIADTGTSAAIFFATYPDGIFHGLTKWILFTIIPVGIANYIPIRVIINSSLELLLLNILICLIFIILAFVIFYRGLKRYSSGNLMSARV